MFFQTPEARPRDLDTTMPVSEAVEPDRFTVTLTRAGWWRFQDTQGHYDTKHFPFREHAEIYARSIRRWEEGG